MHAKTEFQKILLGAVKYMEKYGVFPFRDLVKGLIYFPPEEREEAKSSSAWESIHSSLLMMMIMFELDSSLRRRRLRGPKDEDLFLYNHKT